MAWSDNREELKHIKNDVGSQLALMECKPRYNTVDVPTLLGGHTGKRGGFSFRGKFLHIHPASPVLLHGRNELQEFALALRYQDGGSGDGQTAASGYFGLADEEGGDYQSQQVRLGAEW